MWVSIRFHREKAGNGLQSYDGSPSAGSNRVDVADETSLANALTVHDLEVR